MAILAIGVGDDANRTTSSNCLCNGHMEAFPNLVFA